MERESALLGFIYTGPKKECRITTMYLNCYGASSCNERAFLSLGAMTLLSRNDSVDIKLA